MVDSFFDQLEEFIDRYVSQSEGEPDWDEIVSVLREKADQLAEEHDL